MYGKMNEKSIQKLYIFGYRYGYEISDILKRVWVFFFVELVQIKLFLASRRRTDKQRVNATP